MNRTYTNNYSNKAYYKRNKSVYKEAFSDKFFNFIFAVLTLAASLLRCETAVMIIKIALSFASLAGLISVVHFVEAGSLGFFPAIVISLALLFFCSFIFSREE